MKGAFEWLTLREKAREYSATTRGDETPPSLTQFAEQHPTAARRVFDVTQAFKRELLRRGVAKTRANELCYCVLEQVLAQSEMSQVLLLEMTSKR